MIREILVEVDVPVKKISIVGGRSEAPSVEKVGKELVRKILSRQMPRTARIKYSEIRLVDYDSEKGMVKLSTRITLEIDEVFYIYRGLVTIHGKCKMNKCEPLKATIHLLLVETIKI